MLGDSNTLVKIVTLSFMPPGKNIKTNLCYMFAGPAGRGKALMQVESEWIT